MEGMRVWSGWWEAERTGALVRSFRCSQLFSVEFVWILHQNVKLARCVTLRLIQTVELIASKT